jgi:alpha-ketoglutarate-dependent taurine dioxygenase
VVVYVSYQIRLDNVWLSGPEAVETLRQELLTLARRLRMEHARPGYPDVEADVEVERVEMIGGVDEDSAAPPSMPSPTRKDHC